MRTLPKSGGAFGAQISSFNIGWSFYFDPLKHLSSSHNSREFIVSFKREATALCTLKLFASRSLVQSETPLPRLYWIHIPKTGGTSLYSTIRETFGERRVLRVYDHPTSAVSAGHLVRLPKCYLRNVELIFGHFSFGLHREIRDEFPLYATVLRDPIDLVRSFIAFVDDRYEGMTFLDNPLTRYLSGVGDQEVPGGIQLEHLEQAKNNITKFFIFIGYQNDLQQASDFASGLLDREVIQVPHPNITTRQKTFELPDYVNLDQDLALYTWCRLKISRQSGDNQLFSLQQQKM